VILINQNKHSKKPPRNQTLAVLLAAVALLVAVAFGLRGESLVAVLVAVLSVAAVLAKR
jgi:uncharacterized membrane protein